MSEQQRSLSELATKCLNSTSHVLMKRETYQDWNPVPTASIAVQVTPTRPEIALRAMSKDLRTGVTVGSVGNWATLPIEIVHYSTIITWWKKKEKLTALEVSGRTFASGDSRKRVSLEGRELAGSGGGGLGIGRVGFSVGRVGFSVGRVSFSVGRVGTLVVIDMGTIMRERGRREGTIMRRRGKGNIMRRGEEGTIVRGRGGW